jgi:RHH-type proline utilization regulon transcriptional repressor/proline dehydrogenase/delta 1-pyrroline-5-carboxylate dehydrogenase
VHTRIDETVSQVVAAARAGNIYVNRNIVGAVVGVQPFGGEGLSGTGPKAGGPLYLLRLLADAPVQAARLAVAHAGHAANVPVRGLRAESAAEPSEIGASAREALSALRTWAKQQGQGLLVARCDQAAAESPIGQWVALRGPTGESNLYAVRPREATLCLVDDYAGSEADRLTQLAAVLAAGGYAVWPVQAQPLYERLPAAVRDQVSLAADWTSPVVPFDAVIHHGAPSAWLATAAALAQRPGPIVGLTGLLPGEDRVPLERLVIERSLSINTAAAGGNASLMLIG